MSDAPNTSIKQKLSCSVTVCRNFNNPYSAIDLYQLPKDLSQRKKFSEILGIPISVAQSDTARVCALHFKSKMKNQPPPPSFVTDCTERQTTTTTPGRPKIITVYCHKTTSGMTTTTTTASNVTNTIVKKAAIPEKPPIETISLEEDDCDLVSIADDPVEQCPDMSLELQCEEEPLSDSQLNAELAAYNATNTVAQRSPPTTSTVQNSTVSTQTNPVIIIDYDQISKAQPPTRVSSEESSVLNSAIQNIKITPQVENCAVPLEEPSMLNSSPMGLFTSAIDDASLNSHKPVAVEKSNILPNQPVLAPQSIGSENAASSSIPLLSLVSMAGGSYFTTLSHTTTPSTTVSTAFSLGEKSKLFTLLNPNSVLRQPSGTLPNSTISFIPPVRQVFPSVPSNRVQGTGPTIIQPTYFQNTGQNLLGASMPVSSASSTMLSFANAASYPTQLVRTNCGLALTSSNPQEPISCIPFQNPICLEARPPPPAYQLATQQPFQLISLNEKPNVLSSFSQPLDQQIMNEGQRLGQYSNSSFYSDPYSSTGFKSYPYSNSHFNSNEFQNFSTTDFRETPYQVLVQKNDNTKLIFSNNLPGSTQSVLNTPESSLQVPVAIENDSGEKDDELLAMCNVATIYGSESSTPTEGTATPDPSTVSENQRNLRFGSILEKYSITDTVKKSTTRDISSPDNISTDTAESNSSEQSTGPLIVDVISATEGAKDYYIGDKIPNILFGKNKKGNSKKLRKKLLTNKIEAARYTKTYSVENNQSSTDKSKSVAVPSPVAVAGKSHNKDNQDGPLVHLLFRKQNGPVQAVKLHNSVFSLQTSIPIIPNGQQQCTDPQTLLGLKIPIGRIGKDDAITLRKKLTSEKYVSCSVLWLIRRNYMPLPSPCGCGSYTFNVKRDERFIDGFCWKCASPSCGKEKLMKRPKLFESFKNYTLEELLLLTYHWACQSPFEEVLKDVNLDYDKILAYFKALRDICHKMLIKKCKLGLSASMVETALVKLGNFFVIGAYDRKTCYTRMEAITQLDAYSTTVHIDFLNNWLCKRAVLVSDKKIVNYLLPDVETVSAVPDITDASSNLPHILHISKYLIENLTAIFGKVDQNRLPLDVVKGLLHELQWRGKYAKFFDMSFWSIMNHIRDFNDPNEARTIAIPGEFNVPSQKTTNELCTRWGVPLSEERAEIPEKSVKTQPKVAQLCNPIASQSNSQVSGTSNPHITTVRRNIVPGVRVLNELFQDVPEIPGGSSNITSIALLAIKIRCELSTAPGVYKPNATSLGLQLRTEGFISNPVKWLVKRGYVRPSGPCYVCGKPSLLQESTTYKDGCSWFCQNTKCKFENMFKRPQFFACFKEQTMAQVAAMIFHWTVQSDYNIITSDVPMNSVKICHAWRAFQLVCSAALKRQNYKIGGEGQIVEVALVQFGQLYILGAMERATKRTLLKCFPVNLKYQVDLFYETIRYWILDKTFVVASVNPLFGLSRVTMYYRVFPADTSVTEKNNTRMHVLNITSYLLKHIFEMFGHLKADSVGKELMQIYLDELMWRERYGKLPNLAFAKIMYEIFYYEKNKSILFQESHKVKELFLEDRQSVECPKEVRVILNRIPQTVLKYYKCLPSDYATPKKLPSAATNISDSEDESSDSSEDLMEAVAAALEGESLSDVSSSEMDDIPIKEENPSSSLQTKRKALEVPNRNCNAPSNNRVSRAFRSSKQSPIKGKLPNSVQPLVLKMNKNRKNYQSYLKSEFLKAKYKKQRSRSRFGSRKLSRKKKCVKKAISEAPQAVIEDTFVETKIKIEPGTSGLHQTLSPVNVSEGKPQKRLSAILRRLGTTGEPVCVECGKVVSMDHFMKQFDCTDCKNIVYTTCCSNAFFEHRSALLFGKRMPRRDKVAHGHGLHHPCVLSHAAVCPCGFKSKIGNQIASHMVNCQKNTCFYNDL